jgi:hypothetical protein
LLTEVITATRRSKSDIKEAWKRLAGAQWQSKIILKPCCTGYPADLNAHSIGGT